MKCKNKKIEVNGTIYEERIKKYYFNCPLNCIVTNDEIGKTLSIGDGRLQFTIPFEAIEEYLR